MIEHYIDHDWDVFAYWISLLDFTIFTGLLISSMLQFWAKKHDDDELGLLEYFLLKIAIFKVAMVFLSLNLVKETLQIISEKEDYISWENFFDFLALILVSFC